MSAKTKFSVPHRFEPLDIATNSRASVVARVNDAHTRLRTAALALGLAQQRAFAASVASMDGTLRTVAPELQVSIDVAGMDLDAAARRYAYWLDVLALLTAVQRVPPGGSTTENPTTKKGDV